MSPLLPGVVYSLLPNQCLNCSLLLEETFVSTPQSQYLVIAGGCKFEVQGLCPGWVCGFFREAVQVPAPLSVGREVFSGPNSRREFLAILL